VARKGRALTSTVITEATEADPQGAARADVRVIDTDVHENIGSFDELLPYLEPQWHRYVTDYRLGRRQFEPKPFVSSPTTSKPWEGGTLSASRELMERDLLGESGVDIAIINNAVHQFGAMEGWFECWTAIAHAYNDWQIEQWLDKQPRLRGSVNIVPSNPVAAAREIDRVAAHPQIVQVALPVVNTSQWGEPRYHPIYEAAQRNGLVIAMHHGAQTTSALGYGRYFVEWHTTAMPQAMMSQLASFVVHGVFDKFPALKVVGLEAGFSWAPALMTRFDRQYEQFRHEIPWVKKKPSDHLREKVRLATQPMEALSAKQLGMVVELMGSEDMIMFSSDYPHYDGDMPRETLPAGLPEGLVQKIMGGNARETYRNLDARA
jgi:predicted TIM-barrel fold metal-dependent hydrolase